MPRLHFISNGVFTTSIAGGDIHFLQIADGVAAAGYSLNFFGGHALKQVLQNHKTPGTVTLTDEASMPKVNTGVLGGQLALFRDFWGRYRRTLRLLDQIGADDYAYAVSDYWFDVLPVVRCAARRKLMVLHMEAPQFGQILARSRPDVDALRLASMHYWGSQEVSLRRFCRCRPKHLLYLHPLMRNRLLRLGCAPEEITEVSYGLDIAQTEAVPQPEKMYDVVWIGRVHRQKGIDDLLATLTHLAARLPNFRAVLIGNIKAGLEPRLTAAGLSEKVHIPGFVSETEKIRLFKASRLFLMPSRHEGSPRVIGEAVSCGVAVVAYDIPNYRPLFGDFVRYAPPFDLAAFQNTAERELQELRVGRNYLQNMNLAVFKQENAWPTVIRKFLAALDRMR